MQKQPLVWRKAALQETPSCWTWKDVLFYPIHSFLYKLNKNPSLLVDELIIGSNPIVNLLLLYRLSQECIKNDEHKKVALFFINQIDYWSYNIIQDEVFFDEIYKNYRIKAKNIEELINKILDSISREHLDIYIIDEPELRINYHIKDEYTQGWIFHLFNNVDSQLNEIEQFTKIQNDIKTMIKTEFLHILYKDKMAKKVKWENVGTDKNPILMSKNIKITSLPQGWINTISEEKEDVIYFSNSISQYSYGSAVSIATIPEILKNNSLQQIKI